LYEGDKIVVKDDKLCHYHKMGMIVLDGSENWGKYKDGAGVDWNPQPWRTDDVWDYIINNSNSDIENLIKSDKLPTIKMSKLAYGVEGINTWVRWIVVNKYTDMTVDEWKQWLSENPITVVYELKEPYYEDITPIQSQWVIESLEECNLDIITSVRIKANMSYITNVPSLTTLSTRVSEVKESDNLIYNLTNMLDDEINQ
jgi:hypothetical protein